MKLRFTCGERIPTIKNSQNIVNMTVANVSKFVKNKNKNETRIKTIPFLTHAVPLHHWKILLLEISMSKELNRNCK